MYDAVTPTKGLPPIFQEEWSRAYFVTDVRNEKELPVGSFCYLVQLCFIHSSYLQLCFVVLATMLSADPGLNNLAVLDLELHKVTQKGLD